MAQRAFNNEYVCYQTPMVCELLSSLQKAIGSLAYAKRMARLYEVENVDFLHGDILDVHLLGHQYNVIECVGVLHHMEDPEKGLSRLVERLMPGGILGLGLYSEIARKEIRLIRQANKKIDMAPTIENIRDFRFELLNTQTSSLLKRSILNSRDFYSTSSCRDLLFHEKENQFSLPKIAELLEKYHISFLGLPAATYNTTAELATALQTAINSDSNLSAVDKTVSVDFDIGLSQYGVISNTTGKTSSVNFTELSANLISQFGVAIGGGTLGADATGDLNDAAGIRIRVIGGSLGARGSVSYIEGTAFKLSALFNEFLNPTGVLETKVDTLNNLLAGVEQSRLDLDIRMQALQDSLSSSFAFADGLISQLETTEDFLTQQLSILSSFYTNKN